MNANRTRPLISIIIPVRNDPCHLRKCLNAIRWSDFVDFECIVVDDCSTDDTPDVTSEFNVEVMRLSRAGGPAHARNCGAKAARGDILFFVDADVLIYPDTLAIIARTFDTQPDIAAIIGSYDNEPGDRSFLSQYKNLFHHYVHQTANAEACTFWSGCGAIRREIFLQANGFNESYRRPCIEDVELGYRLTASKHKIQLQKDLQVKHLKRWTLWGLIKTDVFDRGIPWTQLILRDKVIPNDLNLRVSQRLCVALVYVLLSTIAGLALFGAVLSLLFYLPVVCLLAILTINARFYRFFTQQKGAAFAVKVIPLHLLYYFYSGLSYLVGTATYYLTRHRQTHKEPPLRRKVLFVETTE